jgi:hypothetical protein
MPEGKIFHTELKQLLSYTAIKLQSDGINLLLALISREIPSLIRPVAVYGSECWVFTENIKQKLLVFERKILRGIFGPTQKANGEWRLKTNEELEKAINNKNIVRYIKYKRLSWLGHVERMTNERMAKTIYKWKTYATRLKGRPRVRWEDDVRNDLRKMG